MADSDSECAAFFPEGLQNKAIRLGGEWIIAQLRDPAQRAKAIRSIEEPIDSEIRDHVWRLFASEIEGFANKGVEAAYDLMVGVIEKLIQQQAGATGQGG